MEFKTISKENRESLIKAMVYGTIYSDFKIEKISEDNYAAVIYYHSGSVQSAFANAGKKELEYLFKRINEIKYSCTMDKFRELL